MMEMFAKTTEPAADRTLDIVRVFDAPASLLFLAYSKPEHIMKWFGPKEWPVTKCEMDFRVGGEFHFAMTGPEGQKGPPFGGTYHEIVPNKRIVYDNGFEEFDDGRMLVTVTFVEADGKTTLTISTLFDSVARKESYTEQGYIVGTESSLDNMEELLATLKA
jgi:uncharacterized protein YndB with AHSA1/START domain